MGATPGTSSAGDTAAGGRGERPIGRVLVLGAGAVGGAIAARLHASGTPVVCLARGAHAAALRDHGLVLKQPEGAERACMPVIERIEGLAFEPGDVALVTTKLNDAEALLEALARAAGPALPVVLGVNGVAAEAWAAARFRHVATLMVWLPATHLVPGEVLLHATEACRGVLDVGAVEGALAGATSASDVAEPVARALGARLVKAGFAAEYRPDIAAWKRAKWITNLGATAYALAPTDLDPAAAMERARADARAAQAEGRHVLDALGLSRTDDVTFSARVARVAVAPIEGRDRAGSSTWQSRQRGKALETPWIEGALAALAAQHGLDAPVCARLARAAAAHDRSLTAR
ncbi:MAG: 2-dehydropantoate 2-reductase N-terminal domain-containing protein [Planctomycetota bacterium]